MWFVTEVYTHTHPPTHPPTHLQSKDTVTMQYNILMDTQLSPPTLVPHLSWNQTHTCPHTHTYCTHMYNKVWSGLFPSHDWVRSYRVGHINDSNLSTCPPWLLLIPSTHISPLSFSDFVPHICPFSQPLHLSVAHMHSFFCFSLSGLSSPPKPFILSLHVPATLSFSSTFNNLTNFH